MFFVYPASIVISIFFALLFMFKRNPRFFDIVLSVYFILRTIDFLYGWSVHDDIYRLYIPLIWIIFGSSIAKSILIYIYTGSITGRFNRIDKKLAIHTLPLIFKYFVVISCFLIFRSSDAISISEFTTTTQYGQLFFYITMGFVFTYQVTSLLMIRNYRLSITAFTFNSKGYKLNWLIFLLFTEIIMYISVLLFRVLQVEFFSNSGNYYPILDIIDFCLLVFLGVMAYRQGVIDYFEYDFSEIKQQRSEDAKKIANIRKSAPRITISGAETESLAKKVDTYMKEKEPFLDHDFTIRKMSNDIKIPVNLLSGFLNSYYGTTFFDFVNRYRVEKVVEKMNEPASGKFTLISIAYDCGFNSKATFNRVFKKLKGQTPSDYYKRLNIKPDNQ